MSVKSKKTEKMTREMLGMNAIDYLDEMEMEVFGNIMNLARKGKPSDAVRLKANMAVYNKIRPDRTKLDLDVKCTAPYEVLVKNLINKEESDG